MNFTVNNQKIFKQIHVYTILIQAISTIFLDQMQAYTVHKKSMFYAGIRIFNSLPHSLTILKNEKEKFKVALRRYLHTHSFYSVDEFFYV